MAKITKTEEQLTKDLEAAIKKLYKTLPGTQEEKIQNLRTKFESKLQQLIQPKQTKKVSKKKEEPKNKEKEEPSEEMKAILDLLRQLRPHAEIAEQYGKSHGYISAIAKNNGIYSPKAVRELLKTPEVAEMTNQDLAEKTGAYPDAIERISKEVEQEKQERESKKQEEKAKKLKNVRKEQKQKVNLRRKKIQNHQKR